MQLKSELLLSFLVTTKVLDCGSGVEQMRQETYHFAYQEASAELHRILEEFEALSLRKDQIEKIVEALKPFVGLESVNTASELATFAPAETVQYAIPDHYATPEHYAAPEPVQFAVPEVMEQDPELIVYTHLQVADQSLEPYQMLEEQPLELVHHGAEGSQGPVEYSKEPVPDPFQRRIDDALWGWRQRPEGLLSPI